MKTLIVDDVKLSRDGLATLINSYFPEAEIVGSVPTVSEARRIVKSEVVDLLFLDIQLQDGVGFDVLKDVPFNTKVIFITAYEQYAIEAIRNGAFDYLLKPVNVEELLNCISRIREVAEIEKQQKNTSPGETAFKDKLGISSVDAIDYIDIVDIIYLKADGKYTELTHRSGSILSSKNLKMFEYILTDQLFMRVHHSFIVNLAEVKKFSKEDSMLILRDGSNIPVSKSRKELLLKRLIYI
jgi:two-component system, LytTR family, response regulator